MFGFEACAPYSIAVFIDWVLPPYLRHKAGDTTVVFEMGRWVSGVFAETPACVVLI